MVRDYQRPFVLPEGATEVLLVRHGSSTGPRTDGPLDLIGGQHNPPLSADGELQARAVGERLADEVVPVGLFVTPLTRTHQTARPLAELVGLEPKQVDDLAEVRLGDWEGEWQARIARKDPLSTEIFAAERWDVIPNAEPGDQFTARIRRGIDHIADEVGPDAVGIAFLHAGVIAEICRLATGSTGFAFLSAENCSVSAVIRGPGGRWTIRCFNDVSHLRPLRAPVTGTSRVAGASD